MAREIDDKKKRKALRKLRKAAKRAEAEGGPGLSDWEKEFVDEVEERVEKYGSAFADPEKGRLDEPLSARQLQKLREIDKKSRGKGELKRSSFRNKAKTDGFKPRSRDINDDVEIDTPPAPPTRPSGPKLVELPVEPTTSPASKTGTRHQPPKLRLVKSDGDAT